MDKKSIFVMISSVVLVFSILIIGIVLGMKNNQIYLTFSSPLNNNIQTIKLNKGSSIDLNNYNETIEGYEFIGWYTTNTLDYKIDESYVYTSNKTIYAGYSKIVNINEINSLKFSGIYSYTIVSDGTTKIDKSHIKKLLDLGVRRLDLSRCTFKGNIIETQTFNNFSIKEIILGKANIIDTQAFYNCFELETVIFQENLLIIESKAFENCYKLKNINIKNGLIEINENSFYGCDKIEEIFIPETVENISPNFISNCKNLKVINVSQNSNSYISENGILYSKDKTKLIKYPENNININYTLPIEVEEICDYSFYKSNIKNITMNNNLKIVGDYSFYGCNNLTNIEFKDNKSYVLENSVFENCLNLKTVKFNIGLNSLGDSIFKNNKNLEIVEILNSTNIGYDKLTNIGNNLFYGCNKLKTFEIPSSVNIIGNNMFYDCKSLESVVIAGNIKILKNRMFYNCENLIDIDIHSDILNIEDFVFYNCKKLKNNLDLDSVLEIGIFNFYNCEDVEILNLNNVKILGENNFYNCENLQSLNLNNLQVLKSNTIINCQKLELLKLGENLNIIEDDSIINCNNTLIEINNNINFKLENNQLLSSDNEILYWYNKSNETSTEIKKETNTIYNNALCGKTNLESINVNNENTTYISLDDCLVEKENLKLISYPAGKKDDTVIINENILSISKNSIQSLYIKNLTIDKNIEKIENGSLLNLTNLETIILPFIGTNKNIENSQRWIGSIFGCAENKSSVEAFNNGLYLPKSLKNVIITNDTIVSAMSFYNAYNVESIIINEECKTVENKAFYGCNSLKSLTLKGKIEKISEGAFHKLTNLTNLSLGYCENIEVDENSFDDITNKITVYVLCENDVTILPTMQKDYKNNFYKVYYLSKQWSWNIIHKGV